MLIKNLASLAVCSTALVLSAFQQYNTIGTLVATYVVTDFFFTEEPDLQIHHLLVASFVASVSNLNPSDYLIEAQCIVNLEISTLFLALNHLMKDKIIVVPAIVYKVNQYLFVATFAKFRIWDYYWIFMMRPSFPSSLTMITINGIFLLDVYWFFLILRKLYKITFHISSPKYSIPKTEESNPCFSGKNAS
jgi:hypothetical protein